MAVAHEDAPGGGQRRVLIAGLGKRDELDAERARVAAGAAAGRARELGAVSLSWAAVPGAGLAGALAEGTLLRLYSFDRFKTKKSDSDRVESLEIAGEAVDPAEVERARVAAAAANAARDLQNLPANVATPVFLAERAAEIADQHDALELELLDRDAIVARGMGAFAAVAQGSHVEPRLIVLRWRPRGATGPHLAYVGKAVTFDTGGISIKPSAKMQEMKFDMSGGAAVIEAMAGIAELGLPATITAVVGATENMPSGHAVKPGDIVTAMNGTTIEVNNTDAEGRLVLADALSYAVEQGAERIVDLATLTGAILVALGHTYSGLFSNDDDWYSRVEAAGAADRRDRMAHAPASRVPRADQGSVRGPDQRGRATRGHVELRGRVPAPVRGRPPLGPHRHRRHRLGHGPQLRRQGRQRLWHAPADRVGAPPLRGRRSRDWSGPGGWCFVSRRFHGV